LAKRFDGVGLAQKDIQQAVEIGLIDVDGADIVIANEAFGDIGPEVAKLGVPVSEILDEYQAMQGAVGAIADRFRAVFERHIWEPFVERGLPPDEIPSLLADVNRLTDLATSVVTIELHDRFAAFTADYLSQVGDG
jgi:hypothetical protein